MKKLLFILLFLFSCHGISEYQGMTRQEVISAVKECETNNFKAVYRVNIYDEITLVNCYSKDEYQKRFKEKCDCKEK